MYLNKKFISTILIIAVICSNALPAFAQVPAENTISPKVVAMDTSEIDTSVPQELIGMERFLSVTVNGTIQLDTTAALSAGYNENAVLGVNRHLNNINEQVIAGKMIVDGRTFTAYDINFFPSNVAPAALTPNYQLGFSGTYSTWYGITYICFNVVEALSLEHAFEEFTLSCFRLMERLAGLSDNPEFGMVYQGKTYTDTAEKARDLLIVGAGIVGYTSLLYLTTIQNAMQEEVGVTWLIQENFSSGSVGWAFDAQDWNMLAQLV